MLRQVVCHRYVKKLLSSRACHWWSISSVNQVVADTSFGCRMHSTKCGLLLRMFQRKQIANFKDLYWQYNIQWATCRKRIFQNRLILLVKFRFGSPFHNWKSIKFIKKPNSVLYGICHKHEYLFKYNMVMNNTSNKLQDFYATWN